MIIGLLLSLSAMAVPPHPSLLNQGKGATNNGTSYFLDHLDELHARGICTPTVHNASKSKFGAAAATGPFKVLALLVKFSDQNSNVAATKFDSLIFDTLGNTVRDYYDEISYGQLDLITVNLPSSVGWSTAPQTYAYYVNNQNGIGSYPQNSQKLVEDLVDQVDGLIDFSQYDNDGDGYVDAIIVVHSGSGAEYSGNSTDIWSHKWSIFPRQKDGVYISDYTIQPEYWTIPGDMTIGVYAHELGHAFGLPDLYDTDYSSNGIGRWGLMAYGAWLGPSLRGASPAHPSAWSRIEMGFETPVNVTSNLSGVSVDPVETGGSIYRLWNSGAAGPEYFLVENRQKVGYDLYLPGHGLLVWHIDESKLDNTQAWYPGQSAASHYLVGLEQADGLFEMEQLLDLGDGADPFPGTGTKNSFNATSSPNSDSYLAGETTVAIATIFEIGLVVTADFNVGLATGIGDNEGKNVAENFHLKQNYPNPFNPETHISFTTKTNAQVSLVIYNIIGQAVATLIDASLTAGEHTIIWDTHSSSSGDVSSGVYLYRLTVDGYTQTKKMLLLR